MVGFVGLNQLNKKTFDFDQVINFLCTYQILLAFVTKLLILVLSKMRSYLLRYVKPRAMVLDKIHKKESNISNAVSI